ncbi:hypothetical protein DPMN_082390 [Dreissena polymorpha]|uniref:Uncharacterized protein n=1 Tax=Dreissena polymorpha TaxID=45954 RepID=A0A9D4BHF5_DREPO|nr:hypothetical protein DPMN_082390 [Dreissena polymorpha]
MCQRTAEEVKMKWIDTKSLGNVSDVPQKHAGSCPFHKHKKDYFRFVQTTGARGAEAEKVLSEFKLKVPSLIRGRGASCEKARGP